MNPTSPIATACAASSRYAAPSLRYGPSGDATQPAATGFGMAGSALPATNDRRLTGSARPFTPRLNRHKGTRRSSAGCGYPNSRVSSAASIYNNPTTPYSCCQVVQRMGSTSDRKLADLYRLHSTLSSNGNSPRSLGDSGKNHGPTCFIARSDRDHLYVLHRRAIRPVGGAIVKSGVWHGADQAARLHGSV